MEFVREKMIRNIIIIICGTLALIIDADELHIEQNKQTKEQMIVCCRMWADSKKGAFKGIWRRRERER